MKSHTGLYKYIFLLALLTLNNSASARETCYPSSVGENEVVVSIYNDNSCDPPANGGAPSFTYEVYDVSQISFNGNGEKRVCYSWNIPAGYTSTRREFSSQCQGPNRYGEAPYQNSDILVQNNHPLSRGEQFTLEPGETFSGDGSTTDPDGDLLSYSASSATQYGGQFSVISSSGLFTYTPAVGFQGQDSASVYAVDGKGGFNYIFLWFNVGAASGNISLLQVIS